MLHILWTSWGCGTDCRCSWDLHILGLEDTSINVTIFCRLGDYMAINTITMNFVTEQPMVNAITPAMTPSAAMERFSAATCLRRLLHMGCWIHTQRW
uniref:Pathogen-responsive alpha-dioxygenase family protein n=2 Tax=Rhizophora mucronata TaxID=61149 RepID=A0A2P2KGC6_RHIMU